MPEHFHLVAPAGHGKTQAVVRDVLALEGRQLVLTHTHAGVDALKTRLRRLDVNANRFHVDTIAGWALKYASAFPSKSGLPNSKPETNQEWTAAYKGAARILAIPGVRRVVRESYAGVLVDEYQDCTVQQHALVLTLAEFLPCRVYGDPLQAIFGFRDNQIVDWARDVEPTFRALPSLEEPWRWKESNPALGAWLMQARLYLEAGRPVNLTGAPVVWKALPPDGLQIQIEACHKVPAAAGETVVAIHQWPNQCHELSSKLSGRYSCVEPMYSKDLMDAARSIEEASGGERMKEVVSFASKCLTKVGSELRTVVAVLESGKVQRNRAYKHHEQLIALREVVEQDSLRPVSRALTSLTSIEGAALHRRELFDEMCRALAEFETGDHPTLYEAAWQSRERTRRQGRKLPRFTMGRTLLVKGLEFDHAIILDADALDRKNLYVALTRASKSLTILSRRPILTPR